MVEFFQIGRFAIYGKVQDFQAPLGRHAALDHAASAWPGAGRCFVCTGPDVHGSKIDRAQSRRRIEYEGVGLRGHGVRSVGQNREGKGERGK